MNRDDLELLSELVKKQVHDLNASLKVAAEGGVRCDIDVRSHAVYCVGGHHIPLQSVKINLLKAI